MENEEVSRLNAVNRELQAFLKDQLEVILELRDKVAGIELLLEEEEFLRGKYKDCLQRVTSNASRPPNPSWKAKVLELFARMNQF